MFTNWFYSLQDYISSSMPLVVAFLLKVLLCIIVYLIGRKVIVWAVNAFRKMLTRTKMQTGAVTFSCSMCKILLYCVLVLWIGMQFGVTEASVAALVASAGVAIGLAFQGGLSNLAGGFMILVFQPFHVGDYIITQGMEGTVQKIEIMYTTLLTTDTRRVIVPNGTLADNVMVNVTAANRRKLEVKASISYEDSLETAKKVLEGLIEENPDVLHEEEHLVFVSELGDNGVVLGLRCWVPTDQYYPVLWWMNERIKLRFDEAGLHIPYPQMDVHISSEADASPQQHVNFTQAS
ncbi:MAG: mechanosensitive ion channel family protein [Oscillospiraceae bacterium]|nr:mechanosensitive ion channel family protein [Oscillospiraceae bacterium]